MKEEEVAIELAKLFMACRKNYEGGFDVSTDDICEIYDCILQKLKRIKMRHHE